MRPTPLVLAALTVVACAKSDTNRADTTPPAAATAAPSATDPASLRPMLDSAQTHFSDAATKGDVAAMGTFYADDAVIQAPNQKVQKGRAAIDKANTDMFAAMKVTALKLKTDDVITSGDLAVETGTYQQDLQPKTGKAIHDVGKYIVVWKKQPDGSWKIVRENYNSDLPLAKS